MKSIFKRVERKYYLSNNQFIDFLKLIEERLILDKYSKGNGYTVNSVYFDNESNVLIHRSVNKPYFKEKLRARSYSDDLIFLEIKRKIGNIVTKRRINLNNEEYYNFIEKRIIPSDFNEKDTQIAKEILYLIDKHHLVPKLHITYDRIAYYDKDDSTFRITFDHNILYKEYNKEDTKVGVVVPNDEYVMEIKFENSLPLWIVKALNEVGLYDKRSFSKCGRAYKKIIEGDYDYV